jgi:hypothetical protein
VPADVTAVLDAVPGVVADVCTVLLVFEALEPQALTAIRPTSANVAMRPRRRNI